MPVRHDSLGSPGAIKATSSADRRASLLTHWRIVQYLRLQADQCSIHCCRLLLLWLSELCDEALAGAEGTVIISSSRRHSWMVVVVDPSAFGRGLAGAPVALVADGRSAKPPVCSIRRRHACDVVAWLCCAADVKLVLAAERRHWCRVR